LPKYSAFLPEERVSAHTRDIMLSRSFGNLGIQLGVELKILVSISRLLSTSGHSDTLLKIAFGINWKREAGNQNFGILARKTR